MESINFLNLYQRSNAVVPELVDLFLHTDGGLYQMFCSKLVKVAEVELEDCSPLLGGISDLLSRHERLTIQEVRSTYDCGFRILLSEGYVVVLDSVPSSYSDQSEQVFWVISEADQEAFVAELREMEAMEVLGFATESEVESSELNPSNPI